MAVMKNAVGFLFVFALFILNVCADTASSTELISTLNGNPLSTTIDTDTWVHPDHPTSTNTATTWSSRPAASGFWTGPDPFSFVTPSTYRSTTRRPISSVTTTTSDTYLTTTSSVEGSYMSLDLPGSTTTASINVTTTTDSIVFGTTTSMTSSVDVSISTHTNIVTATPTVTTSTTVAATTTDNPTLTVSSEGKNNKNEIALWIGSLCFVFGQYLV